MINYVKSFFYPQPTYTCTVNNTDSPFKSLEPSESELTANIQKSLGIQDAKSSGSQKTPYVEVKLSHRDGNTEYSSSMTVPLNPGLNKEHLRPFARCAETVPLQSENITKVAEKCFHNLVGVIDWGKFMNDLSAALIMQEQQASASGFARGLKTAQQRYVPYTPDEDAKNCFVSISEKTVCFTTPNQIPERVAPKTPIVYETKNTKKTTTHTSILKSSAEITREEVLKFGQCVNNEKAGDSIGHCAGAIENGTVELQHNYSGT